MNERVKELEDRCWVQVPCDFDMRKGGLSTINTVFDRKKFVELLIREYWKERYQHNREDNDWKERYKHNWEDNEQPNS